MQKKEELLEKFKNLIDYPPQIELTDFRAKELDPLHLWKYPHFQKLTGYSEQRVPEPNFQDLFIRRLIQISYEISFSIRNKTRGLQGSTFLFLPKAFPEKHLPCPILSYFTGSMHGIDSFISKDYFADPEKHLNESVDAMGMLYLSYYMHLPIHLICKGIDEKWWDFSLCGDQHIWGSSACYSMGAKLATEEYLRQYAPYIHINDHYAGGISLGAFYTALYSALNPSISKCYLVSGMDTLRNFSSNIRKKPHRMYTRPELIEQGVDITQLYSLIQAQTGLAFSLEDETIRPGHYTTFRNANLLRKKFGNPKIKLDVFRLPKDRFGHSWPAEESINFFSNS